jgi:hypothetical protein
VDSFFVIYGNMKKQKRHTIADCQGLAGLWSWHHSQEKTKRNDQGLGMKGLPRTPGILPRLPSEARRDKAFAMALNTGHQEGSSMNSNKQETPNFA